MHAILQNKYVWEVIFFGFASDYLISRRNQHNHNPDIPNLTAVSQYQ